MTTLFLANVRAVRDRYGDSEELREIASVTPVVPAVPPASAKMTPIEALKAIDCIEYQCDGWPGWTRSDAGMWIRRLRCIATRELPGYAAAPYHRE